MLEKFPNRPLAQQSLSALNRPSGQKNPLFLTKKNVETLAANDHCLGIVTYMTTCNDSSLGNGPAVDEQTLEEVRHHLKTLIKARLHVPLSEADQRWYAELVQAERRLLESRVP